MTEQSREYLSLLAHVYLRHGHHNRAVVILEALRRLGPLNPQAACSLAYCCLELQRFEECLQLLDEVGEGWREIPWIRSRALWGLGLRDEARREIARAAPARDRDDS